MLDLDYTTTFNYSTTTTTQSTDYRRITHKMTSSNKLPPFLDANRLLSVQSHVVSGYVGESYLQRRSSPTLSLIVVIIISSVDQATVRRLFPCNC